MSYDVHRTAPGWRIGPTRSKRWPKSTTNCWRTASECTLGVDFPPLPETKYFYESDSSSYRSVLGACFTDFQFEAVREQRAAIDVGRRETQVQDLRGPSGRDERSSRPAGKTVVPFRVDQIQRNHSVLKVYKSGGAEIFRAN